MDAKGNRITDQWTDGRRGAGHGESRRDGKPQRRFANTLRRRGGLLGLWARWEVGGPSGELRFADFDLRLGEVGSGRQD